MKSQEEWVQHFGYQIGFAVQIDPKEIDANARIGLAQALAFMLAKACYGLMGIHDPSDNELIELCNDFLGNAQKTVASSRQISENSPSDSSSDGSSDKTGD